MIDQSQERFNLSDFVLGYLEETDSIVMPPEFGIYDVLMPEEIAAQLSVEEHTRFAFGAPLLAEAAEEAVRVGVSHPLVETIAQSLTDHPVNARTYIRGVRTDKRGLAELARKQLSLSNGRIDEIPKSREEVTQHHYLLCNFKVTFLSEEKQEDLVAVVMDVQAGHAVMDEELLQRLAILDTEPAFEGLPVAPPRWLDHEDTLAPETLQALLPRAETALREQLTDQVSALAARMERHLSLDLARIGDYYDEMAADLQKRQGRLASDDERRQDFDDKLAMLDAERQAKLDDARSRYQLRVDLKLINVLLATQVKITLPILVTNRSAKIERTVVWDPLLHRLEPLVCDVCGKPSEVLHLCTGGHLAHKDCLAPQCVDCKRAFCQNCSAQIGECVVCHRPVCQASLINCPTCRRGTCNEHKQLCHAVEGQPMTLADSVVQKGDESAKNGTAPSSREAIAEQAEQESGQQRSNTAARSGSTRPSRSKTNKRPKPKTKAEPRKTIVKGVRINVEIHEREPLVVAFVMKSTKRVLATRSFELTPSGILVRCQCEKMTCPADGYYFRPWPPTVITKQIQEQISKLQKEYLIPGKKVQFFHIRYGQPHETQRLVLSGIWQDPARLSEAMSGFDELS